MRSCEKMEILMNLYLDDMLPFDEKRQLEEHLQECQACREQFQQLRAIKDALGQLEEPLPEGLHGRILDYVEKNGPESAHTVSSQPKVFHLRRWARALATVAACAAVAVIAIRFVPDVQLDSVEADSVAPEISYSTMQKPVLESAAPTVPAAPAELESAKEPQLKNEPAVMGTPTPAPAEPFVDSIPEGPLAEDLPPLRQNAPDQEKQLTIRKWLMAQGEQAQLPDWAESALRQDTDEQEQPRTYVLIDYWNEDYWKDQLAACGFVFSDLEGEDLTEDGEKILLLFTWND